MSQAECLCDHINSRLRSLSYNFSEDSRKQKLVINSYKPVYFSVTEGETIANRSARWMQHKHSGGAIHEPGTIAIFDSLRTSAKSIETVFDIGALYGYFSVICLSVFDTANVYSFEMNPFSFAFLKSNIALNRQLDISRSKDFNFAFSDSSEFKKSVIIKDFSLYNSYTLAWQQLLKLRCSNIKDYSKYKLKQVLNRHPQKPSFFELLNIDFWSIDDFCEDKCVLPDLIKMDVEGFQAKIIPGGMEVFEKSKPFLLLEFDRSSAVNSFGLSNKEIVRPLFDLGYQLIWGKHRTQSSVFTPLNYNDLDSSHECNSLGLFFAEEHLCLK